MAVDQRHADGYLKSLMKRFEDNPDELNPVERRIIMKIRKSQQQLGQLSQDISQFRDQIKQGEARLRSLELQAKSEEGKIQGWVEFIVDEKFEPLDLTRPPASPNEEPMRPPPADPRDTSADQSNHVGEMS